MNKQSLITILLTLFLSITGARAFAHDIEVKNDDGVTIYYSWTNNNTELAVSYQGSYSSYYSNEYTGNVVIPKSVVYNENSYGKEQALASIKYPMKQVDSKGKDLYYSELTSNLKCNILPFVEKHPETEFEFFLVPYSISYWYQQKSNGTLEAEIFDARTAIGELLKYDNVNVHFFQDEKSIITNLDLYKDYSHFKPEINSWMTEEMVKESHLLSKESYNQRIDSFYNYLNEFDYDEFYYSQSN